MSMLPKFQAVERDLNAVLLERNQEVRGLLVALVSPGGRHCFFLGEPGVAKTLTVRQTTARITGANLYETQLGRASLPEQLYGPLDLVAFQAGKHRRNPAGKIQEAEVAVVDEIWNCNSAILNSMLGVLNERRYDDGGNPIDLPLITFIGASNQLPQGEDLNALYDRLHIRILVKRLQNASSFRKLLLLQQIPPPSATVTLDEVKSAQKEAAAVRLGPTAIDLLEKTRDGCEKEGVRVSDRKWRESVAILQAEAWLNAHAEVEPGDVGVLQHVLWNAPEERRKVNKIVFEHSCPALPRALELVDLAAEQKKIAKQEPNKAHEAFAKLREAELEIAKISKANGTNASFPQLTKAVSDVISARREVGTLMVGPNL